MVGEASLDEKPESKDREAQSPSSIAKSDDNTPPAAVAEPEVDEWGLPIKNIAPQLKYDDESSEEDFADAEEDVKSEQGQIAVSLKTSDHVTPPGAFVRKNESKEDQHAEASDSSSRISSPLPTSSQKENVSPMTEPAPPKHHAAVRTQQSSPPHEPVSAPTVESQSEEPAAPSSSLDATPEAKESKPKSHSRNVSSMSKKPHSHSLSTSSMKARPSEWSHQQIVTQPEASEDEESAKEETWQQMPAFAPFDVYNDDGKLIAKEQEDSDEEANYGQLGGAGKGYTRVQLDEDAQSATSMDENTAYLFKETSTNLLDEDEEGRDLVDQMQTTKEIMTEGQKIAYVGIVRLVMIEMLKIIEKNDRTRGSRKILDQATEALKMWSQKVMVRLYGHMEIEAAEQIMIEQLAEHGVQPPDLTPTLMLNARIKNPMREEEASKSNLSLITKSDGGKTPEKRPSSEEPQEPSRTPTPLPEKQEPAQDAVPTVKDAAEFAQDKSLDIDLRWTVLCDLFLLLISDAVYDARSRRLLELVGEHLKVETMDICRFEKRVTDALEVQEEANKENWNEDEHMEERRKANKKKRMVMMGLATVGGGLVIGLSAGLLAPLIGAGLAAGFTTFGVAGTGSFLAGAGGAAIITTTGVVTGGNIGFKASERRTGSVKTFEYRPLYNNKRVNLIVTIAGWMTGKVDDVRLPFSTVDPIMGDIYSVHWEPEMLQSMGQTINILATEALTQALQQILGSTVLVALMAAIQLPIVLTKLAYLIDNPWTVSLARADLAGLILADSLIAQHLGARPITLVGFSLGSRVIYACLKELARKGHFGIIQNVFMFGAPMVVKKDEFTKLRAVVCGRFVNGYATTDWILGYLFRATSGGVMRVAGLAPIEQPGFENYNVTEFVPGHMSYRTAMPRLLRETGWVVESDEFTEIEDPDPDNHEKRQRELINEIEEARKQLQEKPEKKGRFGWFRRKNAVEKKEWEMYDEKLREGTEDNTDALEGKASGVLFDVEALRAEVAELAAQGIEVKELPESTLPPMKLDLSSNASSPAIERTMQFREDRSQSAPPSKSSFATPPRSASPLKAESSQSPSKLTTSVTVVGAVGAAGIAGAVAAGSSTPTRERYPTSPESSKVTEDTYAPRPSLTTAMTMPAVPVNLEHNAWADEFDDDFGKEKELEMTFE